MAIWLHFINVLVPITTIEKKLKVDFEEFFEKYDKGIKFHDKHLFATGAMGAEHIEEIVKYFESEGFTTIELIDGKEHFKDLFHLRSGTSILVNNSKYDKSSSIIKLFRRSYLCRGDFTIYDCK